MKMLFSAMMLSSLMACVVVPIPISTMGASSNVGPVSTAPVAATNDFTAALSAFRASQGLGPVRQNAILTRAAQAHAEDMAQRNYFSHSSPGGPNGDNLMQRAASAGCAMRAGAENIANGQRSQTEVLTAWEGSSGHRANMLGRRYTEYGLGRSGNIWVLKLSAGC